MGEDGPDEGNMGVCELEKFTEFDRRPTDGFREDSSELGARGGGCCRILLKPEAPSPCSCSVIMGDLWKQVFVSHSMTL